MVGNEWQRKQGAVEVRLMEECAEVIHAASKGLRFGWNECHPERQVTNREAVAQEMHDLVKAWNELADNLDLPHVRLMNDR